MNSDLTKDICDFITIKIDALLMTVKENVGSTKELSVILKEYNENGDVKLKSLLEKKI